jgi:hypothetical protein
MIFLKKDYLKLPPGTRKILVRIYNIFLTGTMRIVLGSQSQRAKRCRLVGEPNNAELCEIRVTFFFYLHPIFYFQKVLKYN